MAVFPGFPISRPTLANATKAQVRQARTTLAEARPNLARWPSIEALLHE